LVVSDGGTGAGGTHERSTALAWALFGTTVAAVALGTFFAIATRNAHAAVAYAVRGFEFPIALLLGVTGLVLARRLPANPIGWLQLAAAGVIALLFASDGYAIASVHAGWDLPGPAYAGWLVSWLWVLLLSFVGVFVILLFPDGHLPSRRWRPVAWYAAAATAVGVFSAAFVEGPLENFQAMDNPFGIRGFTVEEAEPLLSFLLLAMVAAAASLIVRFRRAGRETRQQIKVMLVAAVAVAVGFVGEALAQGVIGPGLTGRPARLVQVAFLLTVTSIPVAGGIAVLRYGLYEIDVVISKTLVFGFLGAFITTLYALVVAGASAIAGTSDNRWLPLVAAAVVAVAFQPARERIQRVADRLVYGDRASPYEVLASFSSQIGTTFATEDQLTEMARMLGEGTGAARADVFLVVAGEERPGATWPADAPLDLEPDLRVPVVHHGEQLGVLAVTKPRNDPLTTQEEKLTVDLAAQAGIALRNVGLTRELLARVDELRASRQRLVTAQDEERRRIERDLHDGAQQQLVALKIKLGLARMQAEDEGATETAAQLTALAAEAGEALETLRDLAHGIYPPLLAADGLVAALESHARKSSLLVDIEADERGRRYPAEVEVAAYYCCLEALQNASKYADATSVCVDLRVVDDALQFEIRDDGRGFDAGHVAAGAGLRNMTDRVDALAGTLDIESAPGRGTTVRGRIPVA
jgi:signal transduction histidine kinase